MSEAAFAPRAAEGANRQAASELLPLVSAEPRLQAAGRLAQERAGQTPQPTAVVREASLRLTGQNYWNNRQHLSRAGATRTS